VTEPELLWDSLPLDLRVTKVEAELRGGGKTCVLRAWTPNRGFQQLLKRHC
jgi:hypothetical protein